MVPWPGPSPFHDWARRQHAPHPRPVADQVQTVFVPPPPAARTAPPDTVAGAAARSARPGWLLGGLLAGLVAAGAFALAVEAGLLLAAGLGSPADGGVRAGLWSLAPAGAAAALRALSPLAAAAQLAALLALGVLHARLALAGPANPWGRGLLFGGWLWLFAMLAAAPLGGGGPFGLAAGAGPRPAIGLL